jgi:hypothetical protein
MPCLPPPIVDPKNLASIRLLVCGIGNAALSDPARRSTCFDSHLQGCLENKLAAICAGHYRNRKDSDGTGSQRFLVSGN